MPVCHMLIIEDDPIIAMAIEDAAIEAGATSVDFAVSPTEALAAALHRHPELILSDVGIIDGTGPEAVSAILAALGKIPVVYITATPELCIECTYAAAILTKPVTAVRLTAALKSARTIVI